MDEKKTVQEEIEESLRICEEVLNDNPSMVSEKPTIDLDQILGGTGYETSSRLENTESAMTEKQPAIQNIRPLEIPHTETVSGPVKSNKKSEDATEVRTRGKVETKAPRRRGVRTFVSILVCIAIAVGAAVLITYFVATHTTVEGNSMAPCLANGDELIVEKISYLTDKPERFDVIVFKFNENTKYIKRVIGLPGEKVRIEEGKIYINGKAIFDEHANGVMEEAGIAEKTVTLGNDEYFVLGDNRNASKDSRHKDVGAIKADQITGKAWLRMMPFDDFGFIQ